MGHQDPIQVATSVAAEVEEKMDLAELAELVALVEVERAKMPPQTMLQQDPPILVAVEAVAAVRLVFSLEAQEQVVLDLSQ